MKTNADLQKDVQEAINSFTKDDNEIATEVVNAFKWNIEDYAYELTN